MREPSPAPASSDPQISDDEQYQLRTLWFADGRSLAAKVTKVEKGGLRISNPESSGFVEASELCTADRVHYGFGTRKESAWMAQMNANEAKQNPAIVVQTTKA